MAVELGKLKVSPPKGKSRGLTDDILGKKTLAKTSPLSSLKPLGNITNDKKEDSTILTPIDPLSKTDSFTRKAVRLADPIESVPSIRHEPIVSVGGESQESAGEIVDIKPILKEPTLPEEVAESAATSHPILESNASHHAVSEDPFQIIHGATQEEIVTKANDTLQVRKTANDIDFDERSSLQYRETLIRQQSSASSIQHKYSNILDRSSVIDSLHVAILKGDDKLVEQILIPNGRSVTVEAINKLMTRDRHGRTAFHIAAYGTNPRVVDILFLASRLHYGELNFQDLSRLKHERKKCLLDMRASLGNEIMDTDKLDNYKLLAIENWYDREVARIHRKLELEVESAWISAISERDGRGMTPIHYCVCSPDYLTSPVSSLSVLEALLSPICGGRGLILQEDIKKGNALPRQRSGGKTIEMIARKFVCNSIFFHSDSIYNSATGQVVVALQEANAPSSSLNLFQSSQKLSLSSSQTLNRHKTSLTDLTSQYSVDPNLYSSTSEDIAIERAPKVDYEIIIPWLIRNIYKRATVMGEKLGSSAIDILEELVEIVDANFTRTLIAPELKDLLKSLGIMVTNDIVKELCNMYPGSIEVVQEKWGLINRDTRRHPNSLEVYDSDDDTDGKKLSFTSSKKGSKTTKSHKQSKTKHVLKAEPLLPELYDYDTNLAESKHGETKVSEEKLTFCYNPEEEYGLDFNRLIDDIASGRGMKSITSVGETVNSSVKLLEAMPSNQEDIDLDLQNTTETESQLISFDSKLDLPQTLTTSTIVKYRRYVVNVVDEFSSTPVLIATAMNKRDVLDILLSAGGDIALPSTEGHTPLTVATDHLIISSLQKQLMKLLKKNRANIGRIITSDTSTSLSNSNLFGQKTIREFGMTLTETSLPTRLNEPISILSQSCGNTHGLLMHLHQLSLKRWSYSKSALSWAVEGGLDNIVEQLVQVGANVRACDAMGRTPLHHCVALAAEIMIEDNTQLENSISAILKLRSVAEMLLSGGADINAKTISGRTPLHEMFCRGPNLSSSNIILKKSVNPSAKSLCRAKSLFVRTLLHWGSDPSIHDRHGYSPMHYCARENMTSSLIEILKCDVNLLLPCARGRTILHIACLHGCEEVAEVICKWDGDNFEKGILSFQDSSGKIPRDLIAKDMNSTCLRTIWSACREGNPLRVNQLLSRQQRSKLWNYVEEEQSQVVNLETLNNNHSQESFKDLWLLDGVEARTRKKRLTPLHCTVIGWAEASIRSTGNICAKAALDRSFPLRKQISKQKRSIEIYSKKNESHNTVVSMLLQNYAYVDSMDSKGRTSLMYAAATNLVDCLQLLVLGKSDVNRVDSLGNTALHYAYAYGSIAAASFLEGKGASSDIENQEQKTPLEVAGMVNALPPL